MRCRPTSLRWRLSTSPRFPREPRSLGAAHAAGAGGRAPPWDRGVGWKHPCTAVDGTLGTSVHSCASRPDPRRRVSTACVRATRTRVSYVGCCRCWRTGKGGGIWLGKPGRVGRLLAQAASGPVSPDADMAVRRSGEGSGASVRGWLPGSSGPPTWVPVTVAVILETDRSCAVASEGSACGSLCPGWLSTWLATSLLALGALR
jgi:hypothetical protein